jgi:hypothetical protein
VLRTGARWADLPRRYPPPQTCHRRFQKWSREGVLDAVLRALADDLRARAGDALEPVVPVPAPVPDLAGPALLWPRAPRRWPDQTAVLLASPRGMQALGEVSVATGSC